MDDPAEEEHKAPEVKEPSPFIESIHENFPKIISLLEIDPVHGTNTITGEVMQPFGSERLSIVEILGDMVRLNDPGLNSRITDSGVLRRLL